MVLSLLAESEVWVPLSDIVFTPKKIPHNWTYLSSNSNYEYNANMYCTVILFKPVVWLEVSHNGFLLTGLMSK